METLRELLKELGFEDADLAPDARTRSDLELDSTETVQIAIELKRRLGVELELEAGADLELQELAGLIEAARA